MSHRCTRFADAGAFPGRQMNTVREYRPWAEQAVVVVDVQVAGTFGKQ